MRGSNIMRGFALGCGLFQWRSETLGFGVYPFPTIHHAQRSTSERTFQMNQEPQDLSASNPRRRKLPSLKPSSLTSKPGIIQAEANVHSIADAIIQNRFENDVQPLQSAMNSSIGCEHFGTCPGCSVMDQVDNVDVIRSARLYFDSLARQKLMVPPFRGRISKSDVLDDHQNQFRVVIPNESVRHWRTQAKLVVAASASKNPWSKSHNGAGCVFGLYQRNSHSVVSIPQCQVHHPAINQAIQYLEAATAKVQTPACMDESSKSGSSTATVTLRTGLRYVQLQVERTTGKVCLTLVWFSRDVKETQPALSRLTKELMKSQPQLWHSIWLHTHDGLGNNIFSRAPQSSWHLLCGPELLREPLPAEDDARIGFDKSGKRVPWLYFSPQTFRQANLDGFEVLALHVARAVPPSAKVCELYAGVGVLGLTALYYNALQNTSLTWLRCSDENPSNSRCFYRAVNSLPLTVSGRGLTKRRKSRHASKDESFTIAQLVQRMKKPEKLSTRNKQRPEEAEKTSYLVASAGAALLAGQALGANVLIVDPPRKGLDEEVLVELCKPINPTQDDSWETPTILPIPDEKVNWVNSVKTLIYVSCGFEALTRDCDRLFSNRGAGWRLQSATGYVLFPGSDHVETICVFQRS